MVEAVAPAAAMPLVRTLEIQAMVEEPRETMVAGRTWAEGEGRTTKAAETLAAAGETMVAGETTEEVAGKTTAEVAGETTEEAAVRAFFRSSWQLTR